MKKKIHFHKFVQGLNWQLNPLIELVLICFINLIHKGSLKANPCKSEKC